MLMLEHVHVELLQEVLWYVEEQNDFLMLNDLKPFAGHERFKVLQSKICRQIIEIITQQNAANKIKTNLATGDPQSTTTLKLVPYGYHQTHRQLQDKVGGDNAVSIHNKANKQRKKSKNKETVKKKFKCDVCQKMFSKWKYLKRHSNTHEDLNDEIIDVESVQEDDSSVTTLTHAANDTLPNEEVMDASNEPKSKNTELMPYVEPESFKCAHCEASFIMKSDLHVHIRNKHNYSGIFCDICKSVFTYKFEFDLHMIDHRDKMEHKCKLCGYNFEDESKLKKHLQIHMPKNSYYVCDKCNAAFSHQTELENHKKNHHSHRKFNRKECSEKSSCKNKLVEHNRLKHKKDKLYKCQKCPAEYSKRFYLNKHYMKVHEIDNRPTLFCNKCNASFKSLPLLNIHCENDH